MTNHVQPAPRISWLQIAVITAAAVGLYAGIRQIPTGTNLSHTDFRVAEGNAIEFCDPANPQFIPVVAVKSPVALAVAVQGGQAMQGREIQVTATLITSSGKPIAPEDLLVAHTRKLHLLLLDPEMRDYQHVHPEPGVQPGTWVFSFTPRLHGQYRIFADFTPAATARGLYASADLAVAPASTEAVFATDADAAPGASGANQVKKDGFIFSLSPTSAPLKARDVSEFRFTATQADGKPAQLEPVMDALAHLVAVDRTRSGFAHLHPAEDARQIGADNVPALSFKVTIPSPGRYVIWAQVQIGGREYYAPFWFEVV